MKRVILLAVLFGGVVAGPTRAQSNGLRAACDDVGEALRTSCIVAAQAAESAQPQMGLLIAGGNPTIGTASGGGLRLGIIPRLSATVRANLVHARFPDLRETVAGSVADGSYDQLSIVAPSFSAMVAIGLLPGADLAPTVRGIGSVDLLGSASWLPLRALGSRYLRPGAADLSYGGGLRLGLVRESFTLPGASISVLYHRMDRLEWGEICEPGVILLARAEQGRTIEQGECSQSSVGDLGEFGFDLKGWSTRAVVSKHLLGLGVAAGLGYDRFSSELAAGARSSDVGEITPTFSYVRIGGVEATRSSWSAFVNGSVSFLIATLAAEAGWMQGGDEVTGYPGESSDFDPGDGTYFGSVGVRVAL